MSDLVFNAQVTANDDIGSDIWILRLATPHSLSGFAAGEFLHIQVDPTPNPLFRRAYSILSANEDEVEVLYKVMGAGTRLLSHRRPGQSISVLGPLGNTFERPGENADAVLLAGGVGLPPILRYAENLLNDGFDAQRIVLCYGARNVGELALRDRAERLGVRIQYATDDGSLGHQGRITELLMLEVDRVQREGRSLKYYACGPGAMLAACSKVTAERGVPGQLALETPMPCATGVCLGCIIACNGESGEQVFRRTCIDGPIFNAEEVVWP